jgi:hypothetical protein
VTRSNRLTVRRIDASAKSDRNVNERKQYNLVITIAGYAELIVIMARKPGEGNYSEDEIEQILGMEAPEVKFALKEIRKTIKEDPLLVAGLVFAFGMLLGVSLARGHRK